LCRSLVCLAAVAKQQAVGEHVRHQLTRPQLRDVEHLYFGRKPSKMTLKPGPDLVGKIWEVSKPSMESE